MQNKGYYAVQGHPRSLRSLPIKSPYATSYWWLIVTDILSCTVSEISHLIVQILDTLRFWATLWRLKDNIRCSSWTHCKARSGLPISDNWTFFPRCYGWGATSENRLKIGDFAPMRSVWHKISGRRGRSPPIIFAWIVRPMNALKLCRWKFSHK